MIGGAGALADAVERQRAGEQQRAIRALLRRPLLAADADPDAYRLVRRHQQDLRAWFERETGWRLQVDAEVARLRKEPADTADGTRPAVDVRTRTPFGTRRYVLTCLALAALERGEAQCTLGRLAEDVVAAAADPDLVAAGVAFSLEGREERSDLVAVVRLLLDLGVLAQVAGDEQAYVAGTGDALYDVRRPVLAGLLVTRRGPSTVDAAGLEERMDAVRATFAADTPDARTTWLRQRLTRRLLDDPVVLYDDLPEGELDYLSKQRKNLLDRVEAATGLVAEVRAEGIAMVDVAGRVGGGELTDVRMPEEGTDGHATLLLAEHLAEEHWTRFGEPVPLAALRERMAELAAEHRAHWRKGVTEPGAAAALCDLALDRLEALALVRRTPDGVTALPPLARYAVASPTVHGRQDPQT
ncbi:MAG: TIGR02678 family protein [Nitriliruptorales bacterium]|nr:TIGR02678 family protein [Nitriliruptorales bacterium]